jgi:hypothetical protein
MQNYTKKWLALVGTSAIGLPQRAQQATTFPSFFAARLPWV